MMNYQTPVMRSYVAGADLSAKQYHFVKFDTTTGQVVAISSTSDVPCGILMNAPESGQAAEVAISGGGKLKLAGTIAKGGFIKTDATGKGVAATAAIGDYVAARMESIGSTSGVSGDIQPVLLVSFLQGQQGTIGFTPAAGASNVCEVTCQVKDIAGAALSGVFQLLIWLSDAATGVGLTGTTASGTVTAKAASGAVFGTLTAKKALIVQTLADGSFVLEITDSAKTGFYVAAQAFGGTSTQVSAQLVTGNYGV